MALFRIERVSPLPVDEAWRRVTDWPSHARHVPLTTVIVTTTPPTHVGTSFVARTGVGPLAFDDPMEVVRWDPPDAADPAGRCRLEKRGSLLTGWAEIEVRPHPGPGAASQVLWVEEIEVRGLPRRLAGLTAPTGRFLFGRAVSGLLRGRSGVRRPGRST
ncbi:hypothetical protein Misp01_74790 [Microtetraspora sp. NBRC 13810]|uniref:SRPBCC family protein n=1 Tax=Microtetraspora sp. NBRC 13810 TaxID=3030990 RepID=UPI0024A3468A|nr:SRPBCC family protein [Microtetraspora sp. NBRC 13810]GLW12351.1 hypothetical protein Misp01_74790 [Microtetraspora sp. NBRC 13810]